VIDGVTLRNGNAGFNDGGAIELNSGDLFIFRSRLLDNESNASGGAIAAAIGSGDIFVSFSSLRGNRASNRGGGIWCDECTGVKLVFSAILDNLSGNLGGGIYAFGTDVLASTCYISGNTADGGGGIYANYALVQVLDSEMAENEADTLDGGAISTAGTLNIERSTLANNTAANQGGAVYMAGDGGFASGNTTYSGNSALCGGGIALFANFGPGADVLIGTSTFVDNDSSFPGCSEHIFGGWNSFGLYNSILANDPAGGPYDPYCSGSLSDGNHNLIDDASCDNGTATFNLGVVSNLDFSLDNNGGITRTHNLLTGSNAIDSGRNQACLNPWTGAPLAMDQRAQPRPVDHNVDGVAECDIGSVELQ
jgi:predicted outer membrane repeat protein